MRDLDFQRFWQKPRLIVDFLSLFWRQFSENGCRESAAALTYTTLFAIVPMMTVAFSILSAMPSLKEKGVEIQRWVFQYFAPSIGDDIVTQIHEFSRQAGNLTGVGILFLVITSVLMLRTTEQTLNRIWKVRSARKGTTSLLMYWAVLTLGPLGLGAALGLSSYLTSIQILTGAVDYFGGAAMWLSLLPFIAMTMIMAMVYIVVPNCHVPWKFGVIGGAVGALFFEFAKAGFAMFVKSSPSYSVVYGAFAAVPLFLLWLYISWIIFLAGAVLVHSMVVFEEHRKQAPRLQALLRLLSALWRNQQQGKTLKPSEVRAVLLAAGATRWDDFRNVLMDLGLMRRTEDHGFVLVRDLSHLTVAELLDMLPWSINRALRVGDDYLHAWETELASRCELARNGLNTPLSISLEELFEMDAVPSEQILDAGTAEQEGGERV
ncbi:MAG: YihY family inner membrane protein [Alcanivoracaceae bacterium]|nr:YihY family inner membrane protein [Alcanivoracaceae bacterium]